MAEAYLRKYSDEKYDVYSAGLEKHGLNPFAMGVLLEDGIKLEMHKSNTIEELPPIEFDMVLSVCDHANENCPVFPGSGSKLHRNFADPSKQSGTANELVAAFRDTREAIKTYCQEISQDLLANDTSKL